MQPKMLDGHWAKSYVLGRWSSSDSDFHRTSVGGQGDADGFVSIDTFFAKDHVAVAYRLKVTLFRRAGSSATPTLTRLNAVAMNLTNQKNKFPSGTHDDGAEGSRPAAVLAGDPPRRVPGVRQRRRGVVQPDLVVDGRRVLGPSFMPTPRVPVGHRRARASHADPWVYYAARALFDYHYNGGGNWPFNAAYAASRGLVADVTALHDLREAEPFINAGVPLVASVAWESNKLDGGIKSTNGHLMVIGGFTANGNVIAYDPASDTNALVRHVYDREQFERAWIPASGGIVYVIRTAGTNINSLLTANNS